MKMGWPSACWTNFCGTCIACQVSSPHLFVPGMVLLSLYILTGDYKLIVVTPLNLKFQEYLMKMRPPGGWFQRFCRFVMHIRVCSDQLFAPGMVFLSFLRLNLDNGLILTRLQLELNEYLMEMGRPGA